MSANKRPLPPTPSTNRKAIKDINFEEHHNELLRSLEQKEATIHNLKIIVTEWKKKALDHEAALAEAKQRFEEKESFLLKKHQQEIEALTKAQVDQTNENLDLILSLKNENKRLKRSEEIVSSVPRLGTTSQLCDTAEIAHQTATSTEINNRKYSDELVEKINEMMNAMEGTLHGFNQQNYLEDTKIPSLVNDTSSSEEDAQVIEDILEKPEKKKRSIKSGFLFGRR
ncbi:hypothetical protein G6F56_002160 [Rhizopus delemar]|uniref:Uncharacterized protein n=1 Tax=Rhizopus stolonifer TaxID=4846 RepID=A0A367KQA4_RHIST|nr:hypothetical protein G6F56_002160 [Rhizopus delemar]RCI04378.1 hypothetical protein CU098_012631 [Rhizopus stolonifer]